jgi:hypothetical protein
MDRVLCPEALAAVAHLAGVHRTIAVAAVAL